jgi:hypothetical protein
MSTVNALTRYVEAGLMTVIGLVALAGIGRIIFLTF